MGGAEGRRAVVTGAASGIGFAVVQRLLAEGASVLAVDVNADGLMPLSRAGAETIVASVSDPADRDRIAAAAGPHDYIVNSAGVLFVKSIWDVGLDEWRNLYAVNVEGTFFIIQRLGRQMRRGGAIVNLSSSSAKLASTVEVTPYSSSKAAILGVTRSWAYVLARDGIRVNAICPGIVDTPMQDRVLEVVAPMRGTTAEALHEARLKTVPLGRSASPDECAGAIWWLLSDEAGYMTGQAVNYTGGLVMW
ncbi:MAG TPA: SDR family oxidoreductase [Candidatus Limnocylindrales bacterium]|nr:SDR family oxidoreductase [Candidatus Limnocylindrales bacterium]